MVTLNFNLCSNLLAYQVAECQNHSGGICSSGLGFTELSCMHKPLKLAVL